MRQSQLPTLVCVCPSCPPHTHTHTYSWPHKLTQVLKARRRTPPSHTHTHAHEHTHTHTGKLIYLRQQFSTHICKFRKCFIWGLDTHTCMGAEEGGEMGAWKGEEEVKGRGYLPRHCTRCCRCCSTLQVVRPPLAIVGLMFPFHLPPIPFPTPPSPLLAPAHVH